MMNNRTIGNILYYYATWGVNVMSNEKSTVSFSKKYGLLFAVLAMLVIFLLPTPTDLTTAGNRMLGILIFAIIVWITETVSYPVSAAIIATLMFLCLGMNPNPQDPAKLLGTSKAVGMSFGSITSNGAVLVGAALFLAAAMMYTGLDRRIALFLLSKVGANTNHILAGMIFVGFILAFSTETFSAKDCIKVGLPLTIIGYLMMLFFAQTYWHMLGIF